MNLPHPPNTWWLEPRRSTPRLKRLFALVVAIAMPWRWSLTRVGADVILPCCDHSAGVSNAVPQTECGITMWMQKQNSLSIKREVVPRCTTHWSHAGLLTLWHQGLSAILVCIYIYISIQYQYCMRNMDWYGLIHSVDFGVAGVLCNSFSDFLQFSPGL